MSRAISLETFNDAVKENMDVLDMDEDEARDEALNQFRAQGQLIELEESEAWKNFSCRNRYLQIPVKKQLLTLTKLKNHFDQGVDVKNIVMASSFASVDTSHKALEIMLKEKADGVGGEETKKQLSILKEELDRDVSVRVHAGNKVYSTLFEYLIKCDISIINNVLDTLTSLLNGYPDLINKEGVEYILKLLKEDPQETTLIQILKLFRVITEKHERNRETLLKLKIAEIIHGILNAHLQEPNIVKIICQCVRMLVMDDDVRVTIANTHEHARTLSTELLATLTQLTKGNSDVEVLCELLQTINTLIVRNEFCVLVHEGDGLRYILDAMVNYPDNEKLNILCLQVLKGLAGSDEVKEPIIKAGAASLIISSIRSHKGSVKLVGSGCMCISALTLRSPYNGKALGESGAPELIVDCMKIYHKNVFIQTQACAAIRNHVSRCPEYIEEYLQLGVEDLLNQLHVKFGKLEFEAKSVLKELGCDVKLEEQWKGLGQQLTN